MSILLPGDVALENLTKSKTDIYITHGFTQTGNSLTATFAGLFGTTKSSGLSVKTSSKVYYPTVGDQVVGTILDRLGDDIYIVDINTYKNASLPVTAFEGATRRNQSVLKKGTYIFGRVTSADKNLEPTISCKTRSKKSPIYGSLPGGTVFHTSTGISKSCQSERNKKLPAIGRLIPFEIASGDNGVVWISADKPEQILTVWNLIERTFDMDDEKAEEFIEHEIEYGGRKLVF